MTAFRREPCELLTINAIIVKQHRFYPNIKIIRLKRHYLPLVLRPVLHTGEMMLGVEKNPRAAPSHVLTPGPVALK